MSVKEQVHRSVWLSRGSRSGPTRTGPLVSARCRRNPRKKGGVSSTSAVGKGGLVLMLLENRQLCATLSKKGVLT